MQLTSHTSSEITYINLKIYKKNKGSYWKRQDSNFETNIPLLCL